jgi:hypothetical protein
MNRENFNTEYESTIKQSNSSNIVSPNNFNSKINNPVLDFLSKFDISGEFQDESLKSDSFKINKSETQKNMKIFIEECDKFQDIKNIDLNDIEFTSQNISQIGSPGILTYNSGEQTIDLSEIKFLNKGSFGLVFSYENKDKNSENVKVALKTYVHKNDPEIQLIQRFEDMGMDCNIINSKILTSNSVNVAVMDFMHGSLQDLRGKLNINSLVLTISNIAYTLNCLAEKRLSYTDLKTGNVLYKCIGGELKIVMGDVGSICDYGNRGVCTYPTPESLTDGYIICNEESMIWGLGIIFMELLKYPVYKVFYHKNFKQLKNQINSVPEIINHEISICSINNQLTEVPIQTNVNSIQTLNDLLMSMLSYDKSKRISLKDVSEISLLNI